MDGLAESRMQVQTIAGTDVMLFDYQCSVYQIIL